MMTADELIKELDLSPHPEGGYFRETFRDNQAGTRARSTAIYYLLKAGEKSHWHRVDACEVWHWYAGSPLNLSIAEPDGPAVCHVLGSEITKGMSPQIIVPEGHWQAAESTGGWTLVGCTVAPGFEFDGFELAPPGWRPK